MYGRSIAAPHVRKIETPSRCFFFLLVRVVHELPIKYPVKNTNTPPTIT